jgi:hypothetical protein
MKGVRNLLLICCVTASIPACSRERRDAAAVHNTGDAQVTRDQQFVDGYLEKWDRFAQGENQLVPELRDNKAEFEVALARLLRSGDKGAAARMVFYPVVQVGGLIPTDSELGKASAALLGSDFPITTTKEGERVYFGGDLYLWWEANRSKYEPFPLFDEWSKREFAQTVVIPMFRSAAKRR